MLGNLSRKAKIRQLGLIITIWRLHFGEREEMSKGGRRFREGDKRRRGRTRTGV